MTVFPAFHNVLEIKTLIHFIYKYFKVTVIEITS